MSTSQRGLDITLEAGGDLSAAQFLFVTLATDGQVDVTGSAGGAAIGVLQNDPDAAGRAATVRVLGPTKLVAGENGIEPGERLQADSDGKALVAASGDYVLAISLSLADDGDVFNALLVSQHINA